MHYIDSSFHAPVDLAGCGTGSVFTKLLSIEFFITILCYNIFENVLLTKHSEKVLSLIFSPERC